MFDTEVCFQDDWILVDVCLHTERAVHVEGGLGTGVVYTSRWLVVTLRPLYANAGVSLE